MISIVLIYSNITLILIICDGTEDDRFCGNMFSNLTITQNIVLFDLKIAVCVIYCCVGSMRAVCGPLRKS